MSNHKMKYWQSLLQNWRSQGHDGLTIPFIIGSQKYLPASATRQGIAELVNEIADSRDCEVYLNYCFTINDLIFGIRSGKKLDLPVKNILRDGDATSFYLSIFFKDVEPNTESLISLLEERCQRHIDAENYSINDNERGDFTSEEIAFIKHCLI